MEISKTYIVKYAKCKSENKLAKLFEDFLGNFYIEYLFLDGIGWSNILKRISKEDALTLINNQLWQA